MDWFEEITKPPAEPPPPAKPGQQTRAGLGPPAGSPTAAAETRVGRRRGGIAVSRALLVFIGGAASLALAAGTFLVPSHEATTSSAPSRAPLGATASPLATASASATPLPVGTVINVGPTPSPTPQRPTPVDLLTGYVWPLDDANGFQVTLPYGPSEWGEFLVGGKLFHDGLDMATVCWDKVYAVHDGVVLTAGRDYVSYMGWQGDLTLFKKRFASASWKATLPIVIVIDNGDGYRSIYAHEIKVAVKAGQHVKAGQVIGYEGATGNATGCHVHFGIFSPLETATFDNLYKYTVYPNRLPTTITARVDPLLILPYRNDVIEMRTLRPAEAAAWASAHPKAGPEASPKH
jgi:murein DD-endopeptidase MepM/ murein hydrolase activator NlpD